MAYNLSLHRSVSHHSSLAPLEEWISNKGFSDDEAFTGPKWHIPNAEEIQFANELLNLHLESALDELSKICEDSIHSDPGKPQIHFHKNFLILIEVGNNLIQLFDYIT